MKSTGFVRQLDRLGRIVIPIDVRRNLGIQTGDGLEILVSGSDSVLQKWHPGCVFCGGIEGLVKYRVKWICRECVMLLSSR